MELTNKCLIDFWKWYLLPNQRKDYKTNSLRGNDSVVKLRFLAMSFTERYGVFIDFFDSVKIIAEAQRSLQGYKYYVTVTPRFFQAYCTSSRLEARIKVIEKANEAYNNL